MLNDLMTKEFFSFLLPIVAIVAVFTFLSVATWVEGRRKEREAHYRNEFRKKLIEQWGEANAGQVLELLREEAARDEHSGILDLFRESREDEVDPRKRRERLILTGLILTATGLGLGLALIFLSLPRVSGIGLVPLFIGVAILIHAFFFSKVGTSRG